MKLLTIRWQQWVGNGQLYWGLMAVKFFRHLSVPTRFGDSFSTADITGGNMFYCLVTMGGKVLSLGSFYSTPIIISGNSTTCHYFLLTFLTPANVNWTIFQFVLLFGTVSELPTLSAALSSRY